MNQITIRINSKKDVEALSKMSKEFSSFLREIKQYPRYLIIGTLNDTILPLGIYENRSEVESFSKIVLSVSE